MDRPGSMGVTKEGNGFFQSDSFSSGKKNIQWLGEKPDMNTDNVQT